MLSLQIIADDKNTVIYRKSLNKVTGSITASLLLSQVIYWWCQNKSQEFYKFKQACDHELYQKEDSWTEEMGMTPREFDTALKILKDLGLVKTRVTVDRKTFYSVDENILNKALEALYSDTKNSEKDTKNSENCPGSPLDIVNAESAFTYMRNAHLPKQQKRIYLNAESAFSIKEQRLHRDYTETTKEKIIKKESPNPINPKFNPTTELQKPEYESIPETIREKFSVWFADKPGKKTLEAFQYSTRQLMSVDTVAQLWLVNTAIERQINSKGWMAIKAEYYQPQQQQNSYSKPNVEDTWKPKGKHDDPSSYRGIGRKIEAAPFVET